MKLRTFLFVAIALILTVCGAPADKRTSAIANKTTANDAAVPLAEIASDKAVDFMAANEDGLTLSLRQSAGQRTAKERTRTVKGEPVDQATIQKLLSRSGPLKADDSDARVFAFRKSSRKPPRPAEKVSMDVLRDQQSRLPPDTTAGPLELLRYAPEGDVDIVPHLSLTFSQAMVAIQKAADAAQTIPAKLTPQPDGNWQWIGTRTALFKPQSRFAKSTRYKVTVPAGTSSVHDNDLKKDVQFQFSTPTLKINRSYPSGTGFGLNEPFFIEFDQEIDPEALLPYISCKAGNKRIPLERLDTGDETMHQLSGLVSAAKEKRWVALKPTVSMPAASRVILTIKKGAPSAEGPLRTEMAQKFEYQTYQPFVLSKADCGWNDECRPLQHWHLQFNNPIDTGSIDKDGIKISPELPEALIDIQYNRIEISGLSQGNTTYTVTLPGGIRDNFGQSLKKHPPVQFNVTRAQPALFGPRSEMVTLDPAGKPVFQVHAINHSKLKVEINALAPADYTQWESWRNTLRYTDADKPLPPMPGKQLKHSTIATNGVADNVAPVALDLHKWVRQGHRHFGIRVSPTKVSDNRWERPGIVVWVQVTDLGITAFKDRDQLVAWVTELKSGEPERGVTVRMLNDRTSDQTDKVGMCRFEGLRTSKSDGLLIASKGDDVAILPNVSGWGSTSENKNLIIYSFDDRGMYKPGETVHIKGWMRQEDSKNSGSIANIKKPTSKVDWIMNDPRGSKIAKGTASLTALGGFHLKAKLPDDVNLGQATVQFEVHKSDSSVSRGWHRFQIQEFRKPEYEVKASVEAGPHSLGETVTAKVSARYYAGGGLPDADVGWQVFAHEANFQPPNTTGFHFGKWHPWWRHFWNDERSMARYAFAGKTDNNGDHQLDIHLQSLQPAHPMTVEAVANVSDVNRQSWSSSASFLVHPGDVYVGIKSETTFVEPGQEARFTLRVVDTQGNPVRDAKVKVDFKMTDWGWNNNDEDLSQYDDNCQFGSTGNDYVCTFTPKRGGVYQLTATVRDGHQRPNTSVSQLWVSGAKAAPSQSLTQEEVTLVPDQEEYQPGDTASFFIQSPFYPASGVLIVKKNKMLHRQNFQMDGPTTTQSIKLDAVHMPGCTVQVELVGSAERTDKDGHKLEDLPRRPAYATGEIDIKVPVHQRILNVRAIPSQEQAKPGATIEVALEVTDANEAPAVGAEVAVIVVDESVLALSNYLLQDPMAVFYNTVGYHGQTYRHRDQLLLSDVKNLDLAEGGVAPPMAVQSRLEMSMDMSGGEMKESASFARKTPSAPMKKSAGRAAAGGGDAAIAVRENFSSLALFVPGVTTDDNGKATVNVKLPDSLTRYRIMAVAAHGALQFGTGESQVTAQMPLMVRPSAPRFLNFGDQFQLPVILQNQTDKAMTVNVALAATNLKVGTSDTQPVGRRVTVPANDRVELQFDAAAKEPGTARFQVIAADATHSDAARATIPVWTPATTAAFASYGQIDQGPVLQQVNKPSDIYQQFGGLEVSTSSTQLQALTDAYLYLINYPYSCSEQLASRIIAIASLKDVLSAFNAEGLPSKSELQQYVSDAIRTLKTRQGYGGGFGLWRANDNRWPYVSVHVALSLVLARQHGFEVPEQMLRSAMDYLENIDAHIPQWYSAESKRAIKAYAIHVRHRHQQPVGQQAMGILREIPLQKHSMETLGWLLPAIHAASPDDGNAIVRHGINNLAESADIAHFVTSYSDGAHVLMHSERRVDGIWLDALIETHRDSDLIPKLVKGLLKHRKKGRWQSTQENGFILIALHHYFKTFEKITPDFMARVWLGNRLAGEHPFKGRNTTTATLNLPFTVLNATNRLVVEKDGPGRLYYRVGIRYAPTSLELDAADYGMAVTRVYEAVDDPTDVKQLDDGSWQVKAGARVRVRLNMVAPMRRYHVALVDPLPAGFEAINPALAVNTAADRAPSAPGKRSYYWGAWHEHQNMRDERVEAFASLLYAGVYEYAYMARATTPGRFNVAPAKAEEMYTPETFGRSATDKVVIK